MIDEYDLLTKEDVTTWKFREKESLLELDHLEGWFRELVKGTRKGKRRTEKIHSTMEQGVKEIQQLDDRISASKDKEREFLRIEPSLQEVFREIDAGHLPPRSESVVPTSSERRTTVPWVLPRSSFTLNEQDVVTKVKALREERSLIKNEITMKMQGIRFLCTKAIDQDIAIPKKIKEFIVKETQPKGEKPKAKFVVHDPQNFTSFTFLGKPYFARLRQGGAIKILYRAYKSGHPDVSGKAIVRELGFPDSDLRDTFRHTKNKELWGTLIVAGEEKGFYRLNI